MTVIVEDAGDARASGDASTVAFEPP